MPTTPRKAGQEGASDSGEEDRGRRRETGRLDACRKRGFPYTLQGLPPLQNHSVRYNGNRAKKVGGE